MVFLSIAAVSDRNCPASFELAWRIRGLPGEEDLPGRACDV